jgi:7-cyano-7-deazaguanine synthase
MSSSAKSVVLLSAGLDSSVNFLAAQKDSTVVLALTFNYGQRAADKEILCAQKLAQKYNIPHKVVDLSFFKDWGKSSLTDNKLHLPTANEVKIDDFITSTKTAKSVWVPNRNGVFLNIAAGFAESLEAQHIVPGFNLEEAKTFADNSEEFLRATDISFSFSTANQVKNKCYTISKNKTEIVNLGQKLGLDFSMIWPCYQNFDKWCGQCESCLRSLRALENGKIDYKNWIL